MVLFGGILLKVRFNAETMQNGNYVHHQEIVEFDDDWGYEEDDIYDALMDWVKGEVDIWWKVVDE